MLSSVSLDRAGDGFASLVRRVGGDQWASSTPCERWNVRDLVGHVAAGSRMTAALAAGANRDEAITILGLDHLGDDPVTAIDAALAAQLEAFWNLEHGDPIFQHPAGDMSAAQVLRFRLADLLVHQWDLARATGADDSLDTDLVREVWDDVSPMIPMMAASGVFGSGPSGTVTEEAALQHRLLDAMGRRP
jgi:uncharacterized protein (TIGR03086 family)